MLLQLHALGYDAVDGQITVPTIVLIQVLHQ
jgi:hypothetical protein